MSFPIPITIVSNPRAKVACVSREFVVEEKHSALLSGCELCKRPAGAR